MLVLFALLCPARSTAQAPLTESPASRHEETRADPHAIGFAASPEVENRPRSTFENSLMGELACTCGRCDLEPINTCRCDLAATMRGEVRAQLDGLDLSTEEARRTAADAVRASFVARHGPNALGHRLGARARTAGLIVAGTFVTLAAAIALRRRASRQRETGGKPP